MGSWPTEDRAVKGDMFDKGRLLVVGTCGRELGRSPLVPLGISLLMETDEAGAQRDNELK